MLAFDDELSSDEAVQALEDKLPQTMREEPMRPKMSLRQTMLVESMHSRKLGNSNLQRKRRRNCLAQNCPGLLKRGFRLADRSPLLSSLQAVIMPDRSRKPVNPRFPGARSRHSLNRHALTKRIGV